MSESPDTLVPAGDVVNKLTARQETFHGVCNKINKQIGHIDATLKSDPKKYSHDELLAIRKQLADLSEGYGAHALNLDKMAGQVAKQGQYRPEPGEKKDTMTILDVLFFPLMLLKGIIQLLFKCDNYHQRNEPKVNNTIKASDLLIEALEKQEKEQEKETGEEPASPTGP